MFCTTGQGVVQEAVLVPKLHPIVMVRGQEDTEDGQPEGEAELKFQKL